ncbi:MAG: hypothetical protein WKG06_28700 [Segetibacter sp.]
MKFLVFRMVVLNLFLLKVAVYAQTIQPPVITGEKWMDTDGNFINAHGATACFTIIKLITCLVRVRKEKLGLCQTSRGRTTGCLPGVFPATLQKI